MRATVAETAETIEQAVCDAPTFPPFSRNRFDGCVWYEGMMSQARSASNDCARFAAGLEG